MFVQGVAILVCILALSVFLAFSERLADKVIDRNQIDLSNWRAPAAITWAITDLPLSLTVLLLGQHLGWVALALLASGVGRAMIAVGHSTASPATSTGGRIIHIAGNVTLVWFPLIGTLARMLLGSGEVLPAG